MPQVDPSTLPVLSIVAKAVAVAPTWTERLSGSTAASRFTLAFCFATKLALIVVSALRVTVQAAVPLHPPPDQPPKIDPWVDAALSVTCVPVAKFAEQVGPQLIPDGALVTVPVPVPVSAIVSVLVGISAKLAFTLSAALIVTV